MLKCLGEIGKKWLLEIIKEAWTTKVIPRNWEENILLPIRKKGNRL